MDFAPIGIQKQKSLENINPRIFFQLECKLKTNKPSFNRYTGEKKKNKTVFSFAFFFF